MANDPENNMIQKDIISYLKTLSDSDIASHSQKYFKTGEGEYGHGDKFLGIRVPILRNTVKLFQKVSITNIRKLLKSEYHEIRLFALLLMVHQFSKGDIKTRNTIFSLYLQQTKYINNWDLVDSSAPYIVGAWLFDKDRSVLYKLAQSEQLWDRRIAIMSTAYFIKQNQFTDTLKLSEILLNDSEDLIQKAVGWMLREVGNRNPKMEEQFLKKHYKKMPRTMLRYSIEKFSKERRQLYLKGVV
jgi:3-methyladenine DNA glycosylase AlkD